MNALQEQPELEWLGNSFYYPGPGGGGVGVLPIKVANWLLAKSLSLPGGAEQALSTLEQFAQENTVDGFRVLAIYGVYIEKSVELNEKTRLVPVNKLPPSLGLDHMAAVLDSVVHYLPLGKHENPIGMPAISALVQRFKMSPALCRDGGEVPGWHADHLSVFEELEDLAYAAALLPGAMPQVVSRWVETDGVDAIPGLTGGNSGQFEMMEVIPKSFEKLHPLPTEDVTERLGAYMRLSRETRGKIATPLRRLAMVGARRRVADRAIELGIALESLLGDTSTSEMTHKIAVRGSLLVSAQEEDRLWNFKLLKTAYELRSRVVHGGQPKPSKTIDKKTLSTAELINEAKEVARTALNNIVDAGMIPDWTQVDLGIGKFPGHDT